MGLSPVFDVRKHLRDLDRDNMGLLNLVDALCGANKGTVPSLVGSEEAINLPIHKGQPYVACRLGSRIKTLSASLPSCLSQKQI